MKTQKKGHLLEETEKYFVIMMEQQFRINPEKQIVVLFDFTDAGASNMVKIIIVYKCINCKKCRSCMVIYIFYDKIQIKSILI